jgi:tRNA(adenine34) deaminase
MAYCYGSLPHGAVITDARGNVVARGRNRVREQTTEGSQLAGKRIAHAEINALIDMAMDWRAVDIYDCKLYSSIEPCPMCIGAVLMSHMKEVHYAVRDSGAGGTSLIDKTPFFRSNNIQVIGSQDSELETVLMAIQVEATLSQAHPNPEAWIEKMSSGVPLGARLGYQLFETRSLIQWKEEAQEPAFVLDRIHERLMRIS